MATFVLIAFLTTLLGLAMVPVWFLHFGTKRVGANAPSIWKALAAVVLGSVANRVISRVLLPLLIHVNLQIGLAALLVILLCIQWSAIALIYRISLKRAIQAWLWTLIPLCGSGALILLIVRPFLMEAFMVPTNPMAPTILGRHLTGTCPRCGGEAYCTPQDDDGIPQAEMLMICSKELRSCKVVNPNPQEFSGDRFFVAKVLRPRRWDLIAFRYPEDPSTLYIKRLIGLPGETVVIQDGSIFINGQEQVLPESIRGIEYLDRLEGLDLKLWGTADQPAHLGSDEYFVLGDFSRNQKTLGYGNRVLLAILRMRYRNLISWESRRTFIGLPSVGEACANHVAALIMLYRHRFSALRYTFVRGELSLSRLTRSR